MSNNFTSFSMNPPDFPPTYPDPRFWDAMYNSPISPCGTGRISWSRTYAAELRTGEPAKGNFANLSGYLVKGDKVFHSETLEGRAVLHCRNGMQEKCCFGSCFKKVN